jgi:hypothetical protein
LARRTNTDEADRQALLDAAARLAGIAPARIAVFIVEGPYQIVQPTLGVAAPGQVPEGMGAYDSAILGAATDKPISSARLASRAGHRHNSYFRQHLAALVETGMIRHTRRGYSAAQ